MCSHIFCIFTVPSPVVEVTSIDTVEYGKAATLECNVTTVRGLTNSLNIEWITLNVYNYSYTIVRRVNNVTANIVENSTVYTDQLVTQPLSIYDNGGAYYCIVSRDTTFAHDSIVLYFIGK